MYAIICRVKMVDINTDMNVKLEDLRKVELNHVLH